MFFRYILLSLIFLFSLSNVIYANETEKGIKHIGEMTVQRALHNSIMLDDGTVLIYGGFNKMEKYTNGKEGPSYRDNNIYEESFEIYNPIDNSFKTTNLKFDLPKKEKISDLISPEELDKIEKFFKDNEIKFKFIRYEKIDDKRILCLPYYPKYHLSYGLHPVSEYFTIYNLKTKKINEPIYFNLKAEYPNLKPFETKNGTKVLFIYDFYTMANAQSERTRTIYFQIAVFNPDKNTFEKISAPIPTDLFYPHKLIQLENQNIIIEENNIFKYIFNAQTEKTEPLKNYGFRMREDANILPLNNNMILITGGYTVKSEEPKLQEVKKYNGRKYFKLPERIISKDAYIYSF